MTSSLPSIRIRQQKWVDASLSHALMLPKPKGFASMNSSVGWLGINASPICALFSSMFQHCAPPATVADPCRQPTRLKELKTLGTLTCYECPKENATYTASIIVICNARRCAESGQLCHIGGILVGPLKSNPIFHVASWISHKARRPVKSIGADETLAAGEEIDIGKTLVKTYERNL